MAGRGKKIAVVDILSGRRFPSAKEAAEHIGVTRQGVVAHLKRGSRPPLKGRTFMYAHDLSSTVSDKQDIKV